MNILYILDRDNSGTVNQIVKDLVNLLPESSSKKRVKDFGSWSLFFDFGL